jgi:hypothetical protein
MLKYPVVISFLLSACGPSDTCSGTGSVCGDLHSELVYCAKGCVIGGGGSDVCNP